MKNGTVELDYKPVSVKEFKALVDSKKVTIQSLKHNHYNPNNQNKTISIRMTYLPENLIMMVSGVVDELKAIAYLSGELRARIAKVRAMRERQEEQRRSYAPKKDN